MPTKTNSKRKTCTPAQLKEIRRRERQRRVREMFAAIYDAIFN